MARAGLTGISPSETAKQAYRPRCRTSATGYDGPPAEPRFDVCRSAPCRYAPHKTNDIWRSQVFYCAIAE